MKPKDVNEKYENILLKTVYNYDNDSKQKAKFKIGDTVRVSKYKNVFEKSYTANWSTELFTYTLKDYQGNIISGRFYQFELQKTAYIAAYMHFLIVFWLRKY